MAVDVKKLENRLRRELNKTFDECQMGVAVNQEQAETLCDQLKFEKGGGLYSFIWSIFVTGVLYGKGLNRK